MAELHNALGHARCSFQMLLDYTTSIEARYVTTVQDSGGIHISFQSDPAHIHLAILQVQIEAIVVV